MKPHLRIIDANTNRVREALRVLEEAARFIIEAPDLALRLKQMRHDFAHAAPIQALSIYHRDTPGDVGTELTTDQEFTRQNIREVILAAGSRLSEALRVIEEYAKADADETSPRLAKTAERLRYESYDITQKLVQAMGVGRSRQWKLCLLLTESLCTQRPWQAVLEQALAQGVDCVQVREKLMDGRTLLDHVQAVRSIVDRQAALIVNDRPDIAILAGADGVHLGQTDLSPLDVRKLAGNTLTIGVSTATLDQAKAAKVQGADYCGVGPMFATTTKHKPERAGPEYLRAYRAWDGLPHLAIGGITPNNIDQLVEAGVNGIAVSSAICSASDPGEVAASLSQTLAAAVA